METKKIYRKPELETLRFELGVFGSYGGDRDGRRHGGRRGGHGGHDNISLLEWPFGR